MDLRGGQPAHACPLALAWSLMGQARGKFIRAAFEGELRKERLGVSERPKNSAKRVERLGDAGTKKFEIRRRQGKCESGQCVGNVKYL